jgi:pyrimidine nucleoside transport protein
VRTKQDKILIKSFFYDSSSSLLGTVMAAYISFGISASYLLSACVMAAPAALGYAKLVYPETKESLTTSDDVKLIQTKCDNRTYYCF